MPEEHLVVQGVEVDGSHEIGVPAGSSSSAVGVVGEQSATAGGVPARQSACLPACLQVQALLPPHTANTIVHPAKACRLT